MAEAVLDKPVKVKGLRGREAAKQEVSWHDPVILYEGNGHFKGWTLVDLQDYRDTTQLGKLQNHCSGTHFVWVCEYKVWKFLVALRPNGSPASTYHLKDLNPPAEVYKNFKPYPQEVRACMKRSGTYTQKQNVLDAFKAAGVEYEERTYLPSFGFDSYGHYLGPRGLSYMRQVEDNVRIYEARLEQILQRAKDYGPLGKDNPFKHQVDSTRRSLNRAKDEQKNVAKFFPNGYVDPHAAFDLDGRTYGVISVTQRGDGTSLENDGLFINWLIEEKGLKPA